MDYQSILQQSSDNDKIIESIRRKVKYAEAQQKEIHDSSNKEIYQQKRELETLKRENLQLKQQLNEIRASEITAPSQLNNNNNNSNNLNNNNLNNNNNSKSPMKMTLRTKGGRLSAVLSKKNKELESKRDMDSHLIMKLSETQNNNRQLEIKYNENIEIIKQMRKQIGGVNIQQERHESIRKQVSILENRLDNSLIKFNQVLKENKILRDNIDSLRGEREVFEKIYKRLEGELQERKKEMAFIIEVSNISYEERDNNLQVLQSLKSFAAEEMNTFASTFKELDELLENDRRAKEIVKQRTLQLENREEIRIQEERLKAQQRQLQLSERLNRENNNNNNNNNNNKSEAHELEDGFMKLRQVTNISDLNLLVKRFLSSEEENFSLFSFVNDLRKTIQVLEKKRSDIIIDINNITDGNIIDKEKKTKLRELENKLRSEELANQQYINLTQKANNILKGIIEIINNIFTIVGGDESNIIMKHGIIGINLNTLPLYLASIEKSTETLISTFNYENGIIFSDNNNNNNNLNNNNNNNNNIYITRGPLVPIDSAQVVVDVRNLPTTGEEADVSDYEDYPLSREELLRKIQCKMSAVHHDRRAVRGGGKRHISVMKK